MPCPRVNAGVGYNTCMDDLNSFILIWAFIIGISQLMGFLIDLIKWAVRRKHPAKIEKSEDVSYPKFITVNIWHDSHFAHRYIQITFIRKEDNKYKRYIKRSVGGWIGSILLYLFFLVIIFGLPVAGLIIAPNHPDIKFLFGWSLMVFLIFLHSDLTGTDTIARMELNKYLKAQER